MGNTQTENRSKITKISLSGFKSFGRDTASCEIELSDINILIGANGSGKSNFLSFFKMLKYIMSGSFQEYVAKNGFAEQLLHFGSKNTTAIQAHIWFQNAESPNSEYIFDLEKSVNDSLVFTHERTAYTIWGFESEGAQKESFLDGYLREDSAEIKVKEILSNCRIFQFHDTSDSSHLRNACSLSASDYLLPDGGNVASFLYKLKNSSALNKKYYERIVEYVRFAVPNFSDFILEPNPFNKDMIQLKWRAANNFEYEMNASQLSDGSIRFIALAALLLAPPEFLPNVILIDEPELGLHPQAVDYLCQMIRIASENSQVIVATQSPRLVDCFDLEQIIVCDSDRKTHSTVMKHLDENEFSEWLDEYSISQLWEKNVIGGQP